MTTAGRVAYNTILQVAGRVIGLAITLITVNFVSTHLVVDGSAVKGFGQYTIVFTYVSIVGAAADLGLFTLLVREITGKSPSETGKLVGGAMLFRIILLALSMGVFALLYTVMPYSPEVKQGILIGVVIAFSMLFSQVIATIFQANLLSNRIVIVETVGKVLIAALTIVALKMGYGLTTIVMVNLLGNLVTFGLSLVLAQPLARIRLQFDRGLWRKLQPQFWSIALINVLALVHFKVDMLMLTFFQPETEVGIYGVAYKILEVILIVPSIVATNLLPVLTSFFTDGREEEMSRIVRRSAAILFLVATFLAVFVFLFSHSIITFITSHEYLSAVTPLRILAFSILFVFLTTLLSQAVVATRQQADLVKGYIAVVILNVLLNLYAIPRYSYLGAAVTTVTTEAILLAYTYYIASKKFEGVINFRMLLRIMLTAGLTMAIVGLLHGWLGWGIDFTAVTNRTVLAALLIGEFCLTAGIFLTLLLLSVGGSVARWRSLFKLQW